MCIYKGTHDCQLVYTPLNLTMHAQEYVCVCMCWEGELVGRGFHTFLSISNTAKSHDTAVAIFITILYTYVLC